MKEKFYQQKGFITTLVTSLLILTILEFMLNPSSPIRLDGIKILGGAGGSILAVGLLFKWKFARVLLAAVIFLLIVVLSFRLFNTNSDLILRNSLYLLGMITSFYLLVRVKAVKQYVEGK